MTIEEFYDKVLKPIYIKSGTHELISEASAEALFEDARKNLSFHELRNYLLYKIFLWNIQGPEVEALRDLERADFTMGIEDYFN